MDDASPHINTAKCTAIQDLTIAIITLFFTVMATPSAAQDSENVDSQEVPKWSPLNCRCTTQYNPICDEYFRRFTNICYFKCFNDFLAKYNYQKLSMFNCITSEPITPKVISPITET